MRTLRPRLSLSCACAVFALLGWTAGLSRAEDPPPIPTLEQREALLKSHVPAWSPELPDPGRAVHDEYDVVHYDVDLRLDVVAHVITGAVEIQATAQAPDLTQIVLDLYSPMVVDAVWVDGAAAAFTHAGGFLTVTLGQTLQIGDPFGVRCAYHGTPSYAGNPFRWSLHGGTVPMILSYSEPRGAPAWWVCKDDPKDKATFSIHVTAPDNLSTVSNGWLQSVVPNAGGTATYNWVHEYPMSTYLFSIATTNFQSWSEVYTALDHVRTMDVDYFAYPEDLARAQASWGRNLEMMEYYAGIFGEYPFLDEKYAIAEFQHTGAMEHQTATSMGYTWINGTNSNDYVVAHELSHSWVGDMITMREWSHAWTKEGFATLCEALYFEDKYGSAYYHSYMNSLNVLAYAGAQLYNSNPPLAAAIYYKGAWVLHMLRHIIGDPAFFTALFAYTNDPDLMYGVSDTEVLREAFESASGMDLTWFFQQWVYSPGYPRYQVTWSSAPAASGFDLRLHLAQTQVQGPVFKMPIDVLVTTDLGEERFVVWDSLAAQLFVLHTAGAPLALELDPDDWLIEQTVSGADVAGGGTGPRLSIQSEPNPFSGSTRVRFTLPSSGAARLRIFDPAGRAVRTLLERPVGAGTMEVVWDGKADDGSVLPSGIYYQRLDLQDHTLTGRVVRLK